jgi:hypothetical protein
MTRRTKGAWRKITEHPRGCSKSSRSIPPQKADQPQQDVSNKVQEPPETPLMDGWRTMPKGNHSHLIFTGVAGFDPGVAALLADGTPYDFYSANIDDFVINRKVDKTNICAKL